MKSSSQFLYSKKQLQYLYLIPPVSHFLLSCPNLHLILWSTSERLLTRFDNELAINIVLSLKCKMEDIFFVIYSSFLSILVTSFSIGTKTGMYYSVFSPKQVNYFNFSANTFMKKW